MHLPVYFNTIENLYKHIYFVGNSNLVKEIKEYYNQNDNINIYELNITEINDYYLIDDIDSNSIIIFSENYSVKKVIDNNYIEKNVLFLSQVTSDKVSIFNSKVDIDNVIIPLLTNNGVKVLRVYTPNIKRIKDKKKVIICIRIWNKIRVLFPKFFINLRHFVRNTSYLKSSQKQLTNDNSKGYSIMYGNTEYINFDDGFRRTIGNPNNAKNKIYVFGPCFIRGLSSEDKLTIPSLIQKKIPSYKVCNYGSEFGTTNLIMRIPKYKKGDMVVFFENGSLDDELRNDKLYEILDLTQSYNTIPNLWRHIFDDINHYDMVVQKQISKDLIAKLKLMISEQADYSHNATDKIFCLGPMIKKATDLTIFKRELMEDDRIISWIEEIIVELNQRHSVDEYAESKEYQRGAIVMNCNPFTNGHRYLVEKASKDVDELLIFVLREDKSFFRFEDRIEMVRLGVSDLPNVYVFSSGEYMISSKTLPGYFNKSELSDTMVDMSNDLELFTCIAKTLNISVRFAGSEPLDPFTNRYNHKMKEFLPQYGILFKEIERKTKDNNVISASLVRKCLEEEKFDEIAKLVPESTFKVIRNRYGTK